jgi:protein-S-isoprenylcysteine O-methyltransferase Ste14
MNRRKIYRFVFGYIIGVSIFGLFIPFLFYALSKAFSSSALHILPDNFETRLFIAIPLFCIGLIFAISSNAALLIEGKGGPTDAFNVSISPRTEKMVITGPYHYTRNPMAFGMLMVYLALSIYLNSILCLILWVILVLFIVIKIIPSEEKRLTRDFGKEYIAYKKKVPKLVPLTKMKGA